MKKEEGLYHTLTAVEPPQGLYMTIMARIDLAKRRTAKLHAGFAALVALFSGVALVPIAQYTAQQFYASGFYDYLSLLHSDHALVMTYWREFGLSLVESLPSLAILLFVPTITALVWSLARLVKNVHTLRYA